MLLGAGIPASLGRPTEAIFNPPPHYYQRWISSWDSSITYTVLDVVRRLYPHIPLSALRYEGTTDPMPAAGICRLGEGGPSILVGGVELISRVLPVRETRLWCTELRNVLEVLGRSFLYETNESTGLHVHVGQSSNQPLPLAALKNLAVIVTLFEHVMDRLHPAHRSGGNAFLLSNRNSARLGGLGADEVFAAIVGTKSVRALYEVVCHEEKTQETYKFFKYNFHNIMGDTGTVEFRQHPGTLDFTEIIMWIRFCTTLVDRAAQCYTKELRVLLTKDRLDAEDFWGIVKDNMLRAYYGGRIDLSMEGYLKWIAPPRVSST